MSLRTLPSSPSPVQPLWDVVPFEDFSVRLSRHDLHRLVDHLDDITPQQLARLQV